MKLNDYQKHSMERAGCLGDTQQDTLTLTALGLTGEAGEVADVIKKHIFHGHALKTEDLKKELGDVLWYVALGAHALGMTLEEVAQANMDKIKARFPPDGRFTQEQSINRSKG